jgi:hypothetical protein
MGVKLGLSFCDKHNVKVDGKCAIEVTHILDTARILLFIYKKTARYGSGLCLRHRHVKTKKIYIYNLLYLVKRIGLIHTMDHI